MNNEPLTERFRPKTLSDVIGQEKHVAKFKEWVAAPTTMPAAVFMCGEPGLGKTSTARAFFRELFGENWKNFVLEMNASDDRGIDVIRERIINFARTGTLGQEYNIIFLDECDSLTGPAMDALRVPMEKYAATCRFVLSCNQPTKVIQPLIDRCFVMRFQPVEAETLGRHVRKVAESEGASLSDEEVQTIVELSKGSVRKALNLIGGVDEQVSNNARECVDFIYAGKTQEAEIEVIRAFKSGVSRGEFFVEAFNRMVELKRPNKELYILGDYEYRIAVGADPETQTRCWVRHLSYLNEAKK